ncbi:antirestriction protein ArdA [Butyricimonas virosa]
MENLQEAAIYVGTYHKYNCGSIEGRWMNLSDYSDKEEFLEACANLHSDEEDPEFMFQDWENIPEVFIGESWLSEKFFEVRDKMDEMDESKQKAFSAWLDYYSFDIAKKDIDDLVRDFQDQYLGEYDSEEDFAEECVRTMEDLSDFARSYFDYGAYARDLFMDGYDYVDGFVFYCR